MFQNKNDSGMMMMMMIMMMEKNLFYLKLLQGWVGGRGEALYQGLDSTP
jgi:hypothetical protein